MRRVVSAFVAAMVVAGSLSVVTGAREAAEPKPCWSHLDTDPLSETYGQQVAVWAFGGGHVKHYDAGFDMPLGSFDTRAQCEDAFADQSTAE